MSSRPPVTVEKNGTVPERGETPFSASATSSAMDSTWAECEA
ncbi:hypothetical protein EES42_42655 [Streptomyces sp. ADI95-17]|nr:hypothetical protein EES42_42655 [Streptomyces sp. ADI95-17]